MFVGSANDEHLFLEKFIYTDIVIPLDSKGEIECLSIDAIIERTSDNYFVRILACDNADNIYQVFEANNLTYDMDSFELTDYAEETMLLNHFVPLKLEVYISNASLNLQKVNLRFSNKRWKGISDFVKEQSAIKKNQVFSIVKRINAYNESHGKLWRAGITDMSLLSFQKRKEVMRFSNGENLNGLEYYYGGIFEIGEPSENQRIASNETSPYVSSFDWRDRHGKNWITPIRDQGDSGYCWAFSAVAQTEAMANLYYNQLFKMDLSEQDVAWYSTYDHYYVYYYGASINQGVNYIKNNGVIDDDTLPFQDTPYANMPTIRPSGNECVSFNNSYSISNYLIAQNPDTLKNSLIHKGPIASGFNLFNLHHAMLLVGYKTIEEGDTIWMDNEQGQLYGYVYIGSQSPYLGKTCWFFKNSYGVNHAAGHQGYFYFMFH